MEVPPTAEVVAALLDYLVDPMLPLKASDEDPPLETQEAVAKQMHAVVLLYNYYHRQQNPQLEFIDFVAFCKLAVGLKPALTAHMKYTQIADLTGSDDMESQLSVTEKAIKDACKIALALTSLKDVSNAEVWPVSKVSVLLIDYKKENCLLLFSPITNGVWSVIEKCLAVSDLPPVEPSKSKHTNKKKEMGGKVPSCQQNNAELAFQQIALSAVAEATGINQSGVTVLEKHVTYSLSEENMAAHFYIMQCSQSSNEDIQTPIRNVIESVQGPLLQRTSNGWILTPKIEYYNVLPYTPIMSGWLSRDGVSDCSQILNLSSSCEAEKDSETEAVEFEKVDSGSLHNIIFELEYINCNTCQKPEKPSDWQVQDDMESSDANCKGAISYDKEPTGVESSNRKKDFDDKGKPDKNSPENTNYGESIRAESPNREEKVDDKEKPSKCIPEKPIDSEVQDNSCSIYGTCTGDNSFGKEQTGAELRKEEDDEKPEKYSTKQPIVGELTGAYSSIRKEVDKKPNKYPPEKSNDRELTGVDNSNSKEEVDDKEKPGKCTPGKPSASEVQDNRRSLYGTCTVVNSCSKDQTGAEFRKEEVVEKPDKHSTKKPIIDRGLTGADRSNRKKVDESPEKYSPEKPIEGDLTRVESSNRKELVDDKEKCGNNTSATPSEWELQDNRYGANSCSKEPTGEESSNKEVDDKDTPDKHSPEEPNDGTPDGADRYNGKRKEVDDSEQPNTCTAEKPSDGDVQDNRRSIYGNSSDAISFRKEPDNCCDITESSTISLSNFDAEALKTTSAEELQISPTFSSKRQKTDVDGIAETCPSRGSKTRNTSMPIRVYHHQKRKIFENAPGSVIVTRCNMRSSEAMKFSGNEFTDGKLAGIHIQGSISSPLSDIPAADCTLVPYEPNAADDEKLQTVLDTKETEISETALRVLLHKREEMCHQQRILEDKIAMCSRDIQKIIDSDDKDALALKLEAMIDYCNDICLKGKTQNGREIQQSDSERTGQCSTKNKQSNSNFAFHSSCQELDDICHTNNWRSPSYLVSALTGGFVSNVTIKGMGFDFSCEGALLSTPHAARDSAAALMVAKLREI